MTSASRPISNFTSWWGSELADLLQANPSRPKAISIIEIDGEAARLSRIGTSVDGQSNATAMPLADALAQLVKAKLPRAVVLRFPARAFFTRTVMLPHAASRDFSRLLMVDLERATPFKASEVYSGFSLDTARDGKQQPVRHAVIKRSVIDRLREQIEAAGLQLAAVEMRGEAGAATIDIAPHARISDRRQQAIGTVKGLASLTIALTASLILISVHRQERALVGLMEQTSLLKPDAQAVREKQTKAADTDAVIGEFNALRHSAISRAAILEELTRILPDSAWLTEIKIKGASVDIAGLAVSASALMPLIEASAYFVDAQALAPVTLDQQHNKERFGIRMRLTDVADTELQNDSPLGTDVALPGME